MRTLPETKAHRTESELHTLRQMQMRMLRGVWPLLKPGGELLYTTCSILDDENSHVVREFITTTTTARPVTLQWPPGSSRTHGSPIEIHKRSKPKRGATARPSASSLWARRPHCGITFFPSPIHQGGFVALLRKAACAKAELNAAAES